MHKTKSDKSQIPGNTEIDEIMQLVLNFYSFDLSIDKQSFNTNGKSVSECWLIRSKIVLRICRRQF